MKTNYNHWVAWYEHSVKPHVITPHAQTTRCSYASEKKQIKEFQLLDAQKDILHESNSSPRKRQRKEANLVSVETVDGLFISNRNKGASSQSESSGTEDTEYYDAVDIDQSLQDTLKTVFGLNYWVPNQLDSIRSAMLGKTLLIVMPSGPHRNICYQLPASLQPCVTLVLVPQLFYIYSGCISTLFFIDTPHKSLYTVSNLDLLNKIRDVRLLYVTYSHYLKYRSLFFEAHKYISRCVLDEVHHISQWHPNGHPRYQRAVEALTTDFPKIAITALTAMSNERIQADILHFLNTSVEIHKKSVLFS